MEFASKIKRVTLLATVSPDTQVHLASRNWVYDFARKVLAKITVFVWHSRTTSTNVNACQDGQEKIVRPTLTNVCLIPANMGAVA